MEVNLVDVSLILGFLGTVLAAASFFVARTGDARKLEGRLTSLETKIEPIWFAITQQIPRLIISDETPELDVLIEMALKGNDPLTGAQRLRLVELLNGEYLLAEKVGDTARAVAIALYRASLKVEV